MNLCQRVHEGPTGCSERASICRKSNNGDVQVLGLVHTQKLNVTGRVTFCSCIELEMTKSYNLAIVVLKLW